MNEEIERYREQLEHLVEFHSGEEMIWSPAPRRALEALLCDHARLQAALKRLGSLESFTVAFDGAHADAETIWRELRARGEFAQNEARG